MKQEKQLKQTKKKQLKFDVRKTIYTKYQNKEWSLNLNLELKETTYTRHMINTTPAYSPVPCTLTLNMLEGEKPMLYVHGMFNTSSTPTPPLQLLTG